MAYAQRWYHQYYDFNGDLHRVELHEDGFGGGATAITHSTHDPIKLRHMGTKEEVERGFIRGHELTFSFVSPAPTQDSSGSPGLYDDLFTSDYRHFQVKYYINSSLKFIGYPKLDNLSKDYDPENQYIISFTATDALADLRELDFVDSSGLVLAGEYSLLEIIKTALDRTGISLDFKIQLGTYESTYMASNECALEKIEVSGDRFVSPDDDLISCWEALEYVLKIFSCRLCQKDGYYQITNHRELNSYTFEFDWATLTQQSRTATANIKSLNGYKFAPLIENQKIPPLKYYDLTLRMKDVGGNATGVDVEDYLTYWTISFNSKSVSSNILTLRDTIGYWDGETMELTNDFTLQKQTENDYLNISFNYYFEELDPGTMEESPVIILRIKNSNLTGGYSSPITLDPKPGWNHYDSGPLPAFRITDDGDYNVKLEWGVRFDQLYDSDRHATSDYNFKITRMAITKIVNAAEAEADNLTGVVYDRQYHQTTAKNLLREEEEIHLGDVGDLTIVGGLLFLESGVYVNTAKWRSYGNTEDVPIIDIRAQTVLNNRWQYKDYLKIEIHDPDNTLHLDNILALRGQYFTFVSFDKSSKQGIIRADIVELLPTDQSYNDLTFHILDTINGVSKQVASVDTTVSTSTVHNNLSGLQGGLTTQYYHLNSSEYNELHEWLDDVTLGNTGDLTTPGTVAAGTVTGANVTTGSDPGHTHTAYDNYGSWELWVDASDKGGVSSGEDVEFVGGTNVTLDYDLTGGGGSGAKITINASNTTYSGTDPIDVTAGVISLLYDTAYFQLDGVSNKLQVKDNLYANYSHTHTAYAGIAETETITGAWDFTTAPTINSTAISLVGHTHAYDNYGSWDVKIGSATADSISSGEELRIIEGTGISFTRSSGIGWYGIEIDCSVTNTNYYLTAVTVNAINDVDFTMSGTSDILGVDFSHTHSDYVRIATADTITAKHTFTGGGTISTADWRIYDGIWLEFGTAGDSYLQWSGSANGMHFKVVTASKDITFETNTGGYVKLYGNAVNVFQTTSEGINVVGKVVADQFEMDNTPDSNSTATGVIVQLTAGESLVAGNVCHMESDGKMNKSDANASGKYPAFALCLETLSDGTVGDFLLCGVYRYDSYSLTVGANIYLSTTAGAVTSTQPSSTGEIVQVLGRCVHADRIYFNPSLDYLTIT